MIAANVQALLEFAAAHAAVPEDADDRLRLQRARARTAREAKKSKRLAQQRDQAVAAKV